MNNSLKSFLEHHGILKNGKVRIIKDKSTNPYRIGTPHIKRIQ